MTQASRPLDRFLRLFTDVRSGEGVTALLLAVNVFLILTAYYVLKVLREPLILTGGGAEARSYSAAGQVLLLAGVVPLYGLLAGRLPRRRLINLVTAFFIGCLVLFYVLAHARAPIGIAFFLWVGIFNVMIVAQFWAFANDVYSTDEGKRLFPIVGFGASAGAVFGAWVAGRLIEPIGLYQLFLLSGALLVVAAVLSNVVDARERRRRVAERTDALPAATGEYRAETGEFRVPKEEYLEKSGEIRAVKRAPAVTAREEAAREGVGGTGGAFQLVFRNRYLLLIALLILFLNWVNTTGEYILSRTVQRAAATAAETPGVSADAFVGSFYSGFYSVVNVGGLLLQLFAVSRVLKYLGVRVALLVLPVIALGGYALLAFFPVLAAVRWVKTAENSTDYSLQNTVRHVLFLPTTREQKYKAKQVIDSFFWRAGDVLSAALVFVGTTYLVFETEQFAMVNMGLVAMWLTLAVFIGRRYVRVAAATAR